MPCVFHMARPKPFEELSPGCQFSVLEDALISVDGQLWCPYHCPMNEQGGNPTEKAKWDEAQLQAFQDELDRLVTDTLESHHVLDFTGVVFPTKVTYHTLSSVSFYCATFTSDAHFRKATFKGPACFEKTIFRDLAYFYETTFEGAVGFVETTFNGMTWFASATFNGSTDFQKSTFSDHATFMDATFNNSAWFQQATFSNTAGFENVVFSHGANFVRATFNGPAYFGEATFGAGTGFQEVLFSDRADFEKTTFGGNAWFQRATFSYSAEFQEATFNGPADFQSGDDINIEKNLKANIFATAVFTEAVFGSSVSFINRKFLQPAKFNRCTFVEAPKFHGCIIHQGSVFPPKANFKDVTSEGASQAYRTLKLAMEQVRARQEEAMFYALEQESLRTLDATPRSQKVVSLLYQLTADYGESFLRPLGWLAGTTFVCWVLYVGLALGSPKPGAHLGMCAEFTIEQLVRPLSVWLKSSGSDMKGLFENNFFLRFALKVLATLQALTSLSLITLFILALRRRFKLG